jgi:outer membrane protein OmpA-like peptidoglycan-associated protein
VCVIAAVLVSAALAACGGSSHKSHTTRTASTTTRSTTSRTVAPIATAQGVGDGALGAEPLKVSIYDLRRSGPFVTLDFGITCENQSGCGVGSDFAFVTLRDENTPSTIKAFGNTAGGVMLIDPSNRLEYRAVTDSSGRPFASSLPFHVDDSLTHLAWVTFRAPPQTAGTMSVVFPMGGPVVPEVPISSKPAPSPSQLGSGVVAATAAPFAQPPGSTSTAGLTLPFENLVSTVGNTSGSDSESSNKATIALSADVLFQFDKATLTPRAHAVISQVAARIQERATGVVRVDGYTDSIGTDQVNIPLSQARAASVVRALKPQVGGAAVTFQAAGHGSDDPVAPNTLAGGADNPRGRALNRRVTISFTVKRPAAPAPLPAATPSQPAAANSRSATFTAADSTGSSDTYQVTADHLFRDGDTVVLKLTITCQSAGGSSSGTCSGADLAGTPTVPPVPASQQFSFQTQGGSASAIYLADPSSGTQYIPLRDTDGVALTAGVNPSIKAGDSYPLWLMYPAPPASTSSATVVLPGGGTRIGPLPVASSPSG